MKKDKRANKDLQNFTLKTKDRAVRNPLKTKGAPEGLAGHIPHVAPAV